MKNSCHILLIEDDTDDIDLLRSSFKHEQFEVDWDVLTEGDKVVPWLNASKKLPNIIIMDLNLPKMHGRDILKALKASRFQNIPVVILTTSSSRDDIDFCLRNGAEKFFTKPTTTKGFAEIVNFIAELGRVKC